MIPLKAFISNAVLINASIMIIESIEQECLNLFYHYLLIEPVLIQAAQPGHHHKKIYVS